MTAIIFPSDYFSPKKVDESFIEEFNAFKEAGYNTYLINLDGDDKVFPKLEDEDLIYRGWMLTEDQYSKLNERVNGKLIVNVREYLSSHHFHGWYSSIEQFTIKSIVSDEKNAVTDFERSSLDKAFIKDYVKSLKSGKGSIVDSPEDVKRALSDMHKYRGFIEGGVVLREVKSFDEKTENRFFVLNGEVYSKSKDDEMLSFAKEVAKNHNALFFSLDIAKLETGELLVIEIGDGQVSEAKDWNVNDFVSIFSNLKLSNKNKKKLK
jgi:hypothetical protein